MITKIHAIHSLRPGTEWVMQNDDVSTLVWISEGVEPVTSAQVDAEIARLEVLALEKAAADAAARDAAIAHAKSLGFTDEMIAVMYPKLNAPAV